MLSQFRALAKSPVAKVLIFILVASFGLWGIRDVFTYVSHGDAVVSAGSRKISASRFRQMFQDELHQYNQQSGQNITVQDAIAHNVDRQAVDSIASDEAFAELLSRSGVRPSDKLVIDELRKAPRFFSPVSGQFDRQAYEQFVQSIGMTDQEFESVLRDELAQTQFVSGMAAGLRAPLLYSALQAAYIGEGRTFAYFVLPPTAVPPPAQPTDAQLTDFMKQNAQALTRPESRVFTLLRFSTALQLPKTTADPAAVQKRFDFEKDSLSTPEKRSLTEIPVRDAAEGAAAVARLNKGEDPSAVAASLKVQPVVYTASPKTAIADHRVADAAFAMSEGQVQGPVRGDLGLAVIKVVKVFPGHVATLDEQRAKIEAEVRHDAAQALVDKQVQKYEDLRSGGSTLAQAVKAMGVETAALPAVTAQGVTPSAQPQRVPMPPKLLQAGFALTSAGSDTDLIDLGQGEYAALHLEKINPPAPPPLDEIRPLLTRVFMQRDLATRLQARADAIAAQVKKGQSMEEAAKAAGATLGNGVGVLRTAAGQSYSNELLSRVFQAKPGEVVTGPDVKNGMVIAKVQGAVPASGKDASQQAANMRRAASQSVVQDLALAVRAAARDTIRPKVDYQRARAALTGGDQSPAP